MAFELYIKKNSGKSLDHTNAYKALKIYLKE